jgi:hypothetical protein
VGDCFWVVSRVSNDICMLVPNNHNDAKFPHTVLWFWVGSSSVRSRHILINSTLTGTYHLLESIKVRSSRITVS